MAMAKQGGVRFPLPLHRLVLAAAVVASGMVHWHLASRWSCNPDEVPNLAAGVAYIQSQDYYFYSVNPPLVKNILALPAWWTGIPVRPLGEAPGRPEFDAGAALVDQYPEETWRAVVAGRRLMFLFTLVGALAVYRLTLAISSKWPATWAACCWLTMPPVVGQGPMLQADLPCAAIGLLAISSFYRWTRVFSWRYAIESGVLLGAALCTKYSQLVLIVIVISWGVYAWIQRPEPRRIAGRFWAQLASIGLVALLLIGIAFQFQGWGARLGDGQWRSTTFRQFAEPAQLSPSKRWLAQLPLPVPHAVLYGLDIQWGDLQRQAPSFYLGKWHPTGSHFYYPITLAAKLPLTTWAFAATGVVALWRRKQAFAVFYPFAITLLALMASTGMNWHVRYAYVLLPGIACLAGIGIVGAWRWFAAPQSSGLTSRIGSQRWRWVGQSGVVVAVASSLAAAISQPANSFSYTNLAFGNTQRASDWVGGSAVDWNHGWIYAKRWCEEANLKPGQIVLANRREQTLRWAGWKLQQLPTGGLTNLSQPLYLLVSVQTRQYSLRDHGEIDWFDESRRAGTIAGGIEVYRLEQLQPDRRVALMWLAYPDDSPGKTDQPSR